MSKVRKECVSVHYLRGLAALGVVLFHVRVDLWVGWTELRTMNEADMLDKAASLLSIPTPFMGSFVMLFFLLSGFCISLPHLGEEGRSLVWKEYIVRRILRIYPPYLATIGLCFLIEGFMRGFSLSKDVSTWQQFVTTILMVQNYGPGQIVTNPSLWSLPVEVELYLMFPLIYAVLGKFGSSWMMAVSALVSAVGLGLHFLGYSWAVGNFAKYWVIWCAGVWLADCYQKGNLKRPSLEVLSGGGVALGVALAAQLKGVDAALLHFPYAASFFVLLWVGLSYEEQMGKLPVWLARGLGYLGVVSYSLYLIHFPIFRLAGDLWVSLTGGKPVNFLIPLGFTLLVVMLSGPFYRLVELPSHYLAKTLGARMRSR